MARQVLLGVGAAVLPQLMGWAQGTQSAQIPEGIGGLLWTMPALDCSEKGWGLWRFRNPDYRGVCVSVGHTGPCAHIHKGCPQASWLCGGWEGGCCLPGPNPECPLLMTPGPRWCRGVVWALGRCWPGLGPLKGAGGLGDWKDTACLPSPWSGPQHRCQLGKVFQLWGK